MTTLHPPNFCLFIKSAVGSTGLRLRPRFWQRKENGLHGPTYNATIAAAYPGIHGTSSWAKSAPVCLPGTNSDILVTIPCLNRDVSVLDVSRNWLLDSYSFSYYVPQLLLHFPFCALFQHSYEPRQFVPTDSVYL